MSLKNFKKGPLGGIKIISIRCHTPVKNFFSVGKGGGVFKGLLPII